MAGRINWEMVRRANLLWREGKTQEEIAESLNLGVRTISNYVSPRWQAVHRFEYVATGREGLWLGIQILQWQVDQPLTPTDEALGSGVAGDRPVWTKMNLATKVPAKLDALELCLEGHRVRADVLPTDEVRYSGDYDVLFNVPAAIRAEKAEATVSAVVGSNVFTSLPAVIDFK